MYRFSYGQKRKTIVVNTQNVYAFYYFKNLKVEHLKTVNPNFNEMEFYFVFRRALFAVENVTASKLALPLQEC